MHVVCLLKMNCAEFVVSKVDDVVNWARKGSIWPMTFGLVIYCSHVTVSAPNTNFNSFFCFSPFY